MELNIHCRCLSTSCKHHLSLVNLGTGAALEASIWGEVDVHTTDREHSIVKQLLAHSCSVSSPPSQTYSFLGSRHFDCIKCLYLFPHNHMLATHLVIGYLPLSRVSRRASKVLCTLTQKCPDPAWTYYSEAFLCALKYITLIRLWLTEDHPVRSDEKLSRKSVWVSCLACFAPSSPIKGQYSPI